MLNGDLADGVQFTHNGMGIMGPLAIHHGSRLRADNRRLWGGEVDPLPNRARFVNLGTVGIV